MLVFSKKFLRAGQSGQALLIVVLVMVIALTVALSLASRTVTTLRNSTDEAASQAAFSAAEAGVEQAVKLGNVSGTSILSGVLLHDKNNSQISNVDVSLIDGSKFLLNNGNPVFQDDGTDIWLSTHTDDATQLFQAAWNGVLAIHWGINSDTCADPAMEILVIHGTRLAPSLDKYVFDSCATRRAINSFCAIGSNVAPCHSSSVSSQAGSFLVDGVNGSQTYNYRAQIVVSNGLLARVIPLYKAGDIGVTGTNLPIQGKIITSTGTAGVSSSQTVRKVEFFQGFDSVPSEFFYSLFNAQ